MLRRSDEGREIVMTRRVVSAGRLVALAAAGLLIIGMMTGATLEKGGTRVMTGKVVAVEQASRMIVVDAPVQTGVMTIGAEVPDKAVITAGTAAKNLSDIKVGDTVKVKYGREENRLIVQSIAIQ
jgi:hypothetical protein